MTGKFWDGEDVEQLTVLSTFTPLVLFLSGHKI